MKKKEILEILAEKIQDPDYKISYLAGLKANLEDGIFVPEGISNSNAYMTGLRKQVPAGVPLFNEVGEIIKDSNLVLPISSAQKSAYVEQARRKKVKMTDWIESVLSGALDSDIFQKMEQRIKNGYEYYNQHQK